MHEEGEWNDDEIDMQDIFGAMVACDCAVQEHELGANVLVTCPSVELMKTVVDALPEQIVTVYMGAQAVGWTFDHQIDTTENSTNETYTFLNSLVA